MNVVAWARVSSREQKEGYSLDAQLRAMREKAQREGWRILKEFSVAESAKRGADRHEFNSMLKWVRQNAKVQKIGAILSHKLDRACRNIRDASRLQDLEDELGVRPLFVDNQFGMGPAGQLSFNVMASVAQYYSENLRTEVMKGMLEKREQGWLPAFAPFGYVNDTPDRNEPIKIHSKKGPTVTRAFELFATGKFTFEALMDKLKAEGHTYSAALPRIPRNTLSRLLHNRFYVGEITWHGRVFPGKHKRLVDRVTFDAVQAVLEGRNRRMRYVNHPLGGGLLRCAFCSQAITGELIKRKLTDGSVNEHLYYRCANNNPGPEHPPVRWRAAELEEAIVERLRQLRLPNAEVTAWFRKALSAALADEVEHGHRLMSNLTKRSSELKAMRERLLNAYLAGTIDEAAFKVKSDELKLSLDQVCLDLEKDTRLSQEHADMAVAVFNLTQRAADTWLGSNNVVRRELLEVLSLNRTLTDLNLVFEWTKPFDALAEKAILKDGRGGGI